MIKSLQIFVTSLVDDVQYNWIGRIGNTFSNITESWSRT